MLSWFDLIWFDFKSDFICFDSTSILIWFYSIRIDIIGLDRSI